MRKGVPLHEAVVSKRRAFCWRWVPSDKVFFFCRIHVVYNWFLLIRSQTTVYKNIHQTFRRNMAVYHILEFVNNFMQIFEPAHFVNRNEIILLHMWSVFTSQNIFIHRTAILVGISRCLFRPFMAFVKYFNFRLFTNYKRSKQPHWINKTVHIMRMIVVRILHVVRLFLRAANMFCFGTCIIIIVWSLYFIQVVFINHQGIKNQ